MDGRDKASVEQSLLGAILQDDLDHPALQRLLKDNQLIKHNFRYEHPREIECALEGCQTKFSILLIPRQILYPKYCEKHRSEYRRRNSKRS